MIQKFIAIEGVNGSGKSTLVQALKKDLSHFRTVKEPQDYLDGKRTIYTLQPSNQIAMLAASYHHYVETLKGVKYILTDRCFLSSFCYFPKEPWDLTESFRSFGFNLMCRHALKNAQLLLFYTQPKQLFSIELVANDALMTTSLINMHNI